jgi:hypothetical protein
MGVALSLSHTVNLKKITAQRLAVVQIHFCCTKYHSDIHIRLGYATRRAARHRPRVEPHARCLAGSGWRARPGRERGRRTCAVVASLSRGPGLPEGWWRATVARGPYVRWGWTVGIDVVSCVRIRHGLPAPRSERASDSDSRWRCGCNLYVRMHIAYFTWRIDSGGRHTYAVSRLTISRTSILISLSGTTVRMHMFTATLSTTRYMQLGISSLWSPQLSTRLY